MEAVKKQKGIIKLERKQRVTMTLREVDLKVLDKFCPENRSVAMRFILDHIRESKGWTFDE